MIVEIGTETPIFLFWEYLFPEAEIVPEKEYISGIFVAVYIRNRVDLGYLATYIFTEL
jgi:hypothetical protein